MGIIDKLFYKVRVSRAYGGETREEKELSFTKIGIGMILIVVVLFSVLWTAPLRTVPQNHAAIRYNRLTRTVYTDDVYREGMHYVGFFGVFYSYPLNVQRFEFTEGDVIKVRTHDGLNLDINAWVQFRVQPNEIGKIYRTYGTFSDLRNSLRSPTRSAANNLITREDAEYVYQFKDQLGAKFTDELNKFYGDYFVEVTASDFRSIDFPNSYEDAQKAKLEAEQLIEQAKFDLEQERVRAEQAVVRADGVANASIREAEGQAEAAFKVREQMDMSNAEYLQWLYLQQLGNLENPQIVIVTGDEVPEFLIPLAEGQP